MRIGFKQFGLALSVVFTLLGCGGATVSDRDGMGSETDWLSSCKEDSDCDDGQCLCGVCTRPCEANDECDGKLGADCLRAEELRGCGSPPAMDRGICVDEAALEKVEIHLDPTGSVQLDDVSERRWERVDALNQDSVDKIDLLFMIDNSLSMGDKQALLAEALPDLVRRLVDPVCIHDTNGDTRQAENGQCPMDYAREFQPIDNIHIGAISSSLGGWGSEIDCTIAEEGETDNARLIGSLPRIRAMLPTTPDFLTWCPPGSNSEVNGECEVTQETSNGDANAFSAVFQDQVIATAEQGCGYEPLLESWYRFLVDPYPPALIERQNCPFGNDTDQLCIGPAIDPSTGGPDVDETILAQRKAFLRADSMLAIIMLTDENDCSFKSSGQSWRLAQAYRYDAQGNVVPSRAYRAASICQTAPNDACCVSCGASVPSGCATETNDDGETVSAGCTDPIYQSADDLAQAGISEPTDDAVNLRCFDNKRRFGVDYMYPIARYVNALKNPNLCPFADDLDPNAVGSDGFPVCGADQEYVVTNPLYDDLSYPDRVAVDPMATPATPRSSELVFLAGIVGVPWQDIAVDRNAETLVYKTNDPNDAEPIDWNLLLGSPTVGAPYDLLRAPPGDPLMHEQLEPRTGTDTSINGGEWNVLDKDDLQYVCTFPLHEPIACPDIDDVEPGVTISCDCTYYGDPAYENPLCQGGSQVRAKAYPGIRPLQLLRDFGRNSIVASICPKNVTNKAAADYGYRPAVAAIIGGLKRRLRTPCLGGAPLPLTEREGGLAPNCSIVEVTPGLQPCAPDASRVAAESDVAERVRERLYEIAVCSELDGDCHDFSQCAIAPLEPGTDEHRSCLESAVPSGDGWCYVDPAQGLGSEELVAACPEGSQRTIRFAGWAAAKADLAFRLLVCQND